MRGLDYSSGVIQSTGRDFDIAVNDNGFIAIRGSDGKEAYTRRGRPARDGLTPAR